jgi:sporulation protein YlmC with PRC-barrel domain
MFMRPSELEGKNVIETGGRILGTVSGIEIDLLSWKVTHLKVQLSYDAVESLGYKRPRFGHIEIMISVDTVKAVSDVVTLDKSIKDLRSAISPPN